MGNRLYGRLCAAAFCIDFLVDLKTRASLPVLKSASVTGSNGYRSSFSPDALLQLMCGSSDRKRMKVRQTIAVRGLPLSPSQFKVMKWTTQNTTARHSVSEIVP